MCVVLIEDNVWSNFLSTLLQLLSSNNLLFIGYFLLKTGSDTKWVKGSDLMLLLLFALCSNIPLWCKQNRRVGDVMKSSELS